MRMGKRAQNSKMTNFPLILTNNYSYLMSFPLPRSQPGLYAHIVVHAVNWTTLYTIPAGMSHSRFLGPTSEAETKVLFQPSLKIRFSFLLIFKKVQPTDIPIGSQNNNSTKIVKLMLAPSWDLIFIYKTC
jgi:hypothetical protein